MIKEFNTYLKNADSDFWRDMCYKHGSRKILKKGEIFAEKGDVARYLCYIQDGSMKYVVYTSDGDEKVIGLETVGGFAASFPYCLHNLPSVATIIVNTESEVYSLPVEKIKELASIDPFLQQKIEETLEAVFYNIYDRYIELYALSPKERYDKLIKRCPQLFDIFQIKDIASYLGITHQYLNRLRKNSSSNS